MKIVEKYYFLSKIICILLVYIKILIFSSNCSLQKFQDKSSSTSLSPRKSHVVFSNFKADSKLSIYSEKFSKKGSILVLRDGKISPNAIYSEYILSSIPSQSIELTKAIFKVEIPRFSLSEKIYVGNFFHRDRMETMEIELERVYTRIRQGKDIETLLEPKFSSEFKDSEVMEKLVFIPKKDFSLWKAEEWVIQNQKPFLWRNYEEGTGLLSKVSFSEFHSPLGTLYAKIIYPQDYHYIFGRDSNPISLFSFFDFEIVADLKPFLGKQEISASLNPALLNKNSLPKLSIHKILNTNGN